MTGRSKTGFQTAFVLTGFAIAANAMAFQGKALLSDAADRVKPGNLSLCTLWSGDEIKLSKATYGNFASNLVADVTDTIASMLRPDGLHFQVSTSVLKLDPAPRVPKTLKIEYTLNGAPQERTMVDGGFMIVDHIGRKIERLADNVIDAVFAPDGKQVVFGTQGAIKTLDLQSRKVKDVGRYSATNELVWFTWGDGDNIYYSDGEKLREVHRLNLPSGEVTVVNKGYGGRMTVSHDGTRLAWVMPPVAGFVGGKRFRYQGGCGGAVSPSGRYLTSNLTTSHNLIGILEMGTNGPSEQLIQTIVSPEKPYAVNGFHFGRTDEWVCYTIEHPKSVNPLAYLTHWPSGQYICIAEKQVIKDFFDESNVLPAGAKLEGIAVCQDGPFNRPLKHVWANVAATHPHKVVGYYRTADGKVCTPRLTAGVTWSFNTRFVKVDANGVSGLQPAARQEVAATFQGKSVVLEVTVLPELQGEGFKAEFFSDGNYATNVLTRIDPALDFRWEGAMSPDAKIDGRRPWSAQWSGELEVQIEGEYTFGFLQGEGNDRLITQPNGEKVSAYGVWLNDELILATSVRGNQPWSLPLVSKPIALKPGRHPVKVRTMDASGHPVVARLTWSGPGFDGRVLGKPHVHAAK